MGQRGTGTGMYDPAFEKDSCGFGLIAQLDDRPSRAIVDAALDALRRMTHRGAVAADGKSGDGCGLLLRRPESFLRKLAAEAGIPLPESFASGIVFLPHDEADAARARVTLEAEIGAAGLMLAGWREVPIDIEVCGVEASVDYLGAVHGVGCHFDQRYGSVCEVCGCDRGVKNLSGIYCVVGEVCGGEAGGRAVVAVVAGALTRPLAVIPAWVESRLGRRSVADTAPAPPASEPVPLG